MIAFRLLGLRDVPVAPRALQLRLSGAGLEAEVLATGDSGFAVQHEGGPAIVAVSPLPVREATADLLRRIRGARPESAVHWLEQRLGRVVVAWDVRAEEGADEGCGSEVLLAVLDGLRRQCRAIVDGPHGVTNDDGHLILPVGGTAPVGVAVLDDTGRWQPFTLQPADQDACRAFASGALPRALGR